MAILEFALLAFTSIIVITEPSTTIPSFLALTMELGVKERRRLALKIAAISLILLAFFALTGHLLFVVFNITHGAFTIAGGILLIYVAFGMLRPKKAENASEEHQNAVIPLAFPLTAGPGAITSYSSNVSSKQPVRDSSGVYGNRRCNADSVPRAGLFQQIG